MSNIINGVQVPFVPIIKNDGIIGSKSAERKNSFDSLFETELNKIKFSNHASKRLESRNIQLSENELGKLNEAVSKAENKGAKDSLVMMNDTAFIVNIPNRTVVTAMPIGNGAEENVFTNIDSVVFAQ